MSMGAHPGVSELLPSETWDILAEISGAVLVDVRTKAEWAFVGKPDLTSLDQQILCVEWSGFPEMSPNPRFADEVADALAGFVPSKAFFICRSGARSMSAARSMTQVFQAKGQPTECINVAEGFEGDLDAQGHRGGLNGWKARGLPWSQS